MILEAVWFKNKKEIYKVSPVVDVVSYEIMKNINDIEIYNGIQWHSCEENHFEADDFIIRIKKD